MRHAITAVALAMASNWLAAAPAYECRKASGEVERLICQDEELGKLDARMAEVFAAAKKKAANERPPMLKAEQRGWIKGRNDCWKSSDVRSCVIDEYQRRIVELQARYRLVAARGPYAFTCEGNPANELVVTHFATEPPSLIAERGDQVSLMVAQPAASGSRYQGRNESFWEHQGVATVVWGHGTAEMRCALKP